MLQTDQREIHGLPVRIVNTRPEIQTEEVAQRLAAALDLIATYAARCYRRLRSDLAGFVVERFACRGAFFPMSRECLVELTFTVNPQVSLPEIAASIVHEATHARVARRCGSLPPRPTGRGAAWAPPQLRGREERLCRRVELDFGLALPDGAVVVRRAQASLALTEQEVAPTIDWEAAARRVSEVDASARRTT